MHKFEREAMNTTMELTIDGVEKNYAASAAEDLFWALGNLEEQLSMFISYSEISIINLMKPGDIRRVNDTTLEVLAGAMYVSELTKGAVDICMGEFFLNAKGKEKIAEPRAAKFALSPDELLVQKLEDGRIDLGAIGKGFAVDFLADRLVNTWGITQALISFGGSSILALDPPTGADSWELTFAGKYIPDLQIKNCAIGASGTAVQGEHILDCRTKRPPQNAPYRAWAICDSALLADGLSTSFMLLTREEIVEICKKENMRAALQQHDGDELELLP